MVATLIQTTEYSLLHVDLFEKSHKRTVTEQ